MFNYIMNKLGYYKKNDLMIQEYTNKFSDTFINKVKTFGVSYRISEYELKNSYRYNFEAMIKNRLYDELLKKIKIADILDISKEKVDYNGDLIYRLELKYLKG